MEQISQRLLISLQKTIEKMKSAKKLKICIVSEFCIPYLYGGGEFRYYFLIKELQKMGHEVNWICMRFKDKKGRIQKKEVINGINVVHLGPLIKKPPFRTFFNLIHYSASLLAYLLKNRYDIIDAQTFIPLIPTLLASKITNTNMVATIHDVSKGKKNQWLQFGLVAPFFEKLICKLPYKKIITVSDSVKKRLIKDFKIRTNRITVVNNAVDLKFIDEIQPNYKPGSDYKKEKDSICFMGRLANNKRVQDLIKAIKNLKKDYPKIKLTIMGKGPEEVNLKRLVKELRLNNNVKFLIGIDDKKKFQELKKNEIFVLPSVREGFGIVLIEAMACQNAVIGSKVDGVINVINDGKDGLFFKPKSVEDLTKKIKTLLINKSLRAKIIANGRKKVEQQFRWELKAKEIEQVYLKDLRERVDG